MQLLKKLFNLGQTEANKLILLEHILKFRDNSGINWTQRITSSDVDSICVERDFNNPALQRVLFVLQMYEPRTFALLVPLFERLDELNISESITTTLQLIVAIKTQKQCPKNEKVLQMHQRQRQVDIEAQYLNLISFNSQYSQILQHQDEYYDSFIANQIKLMAKNGQYSKLDELFTIYQLNSQMQTKNDQTKLNRYLSLIGQLSPTINEFLMGSGVFLIEQNTIKFLKRIAQQQDDQIEYIDMLQVGQVQQLLGIAMVNSQIQTCVGYIVQNFRLFYEHKQKVNVQKLKQLIMNSFAQVDYITYKQVAKLSGTNNMCTVDEYYKLQQAQLMNKLENIVLQHIVIEDDLHTVQFKQKDIKDEIEIQIGFTVDKELYIEAIAKLQEEAIAKLQDPVAFEAIIKRQGGRLYEMWLNRNRPSDINKLIATEVQDEQPELEPNQLLKSTTRQNIIQTITQNETDPILPELEPMQHSINVPEAFKSQKSAPLEIKQIIRTENYMQLESDEIDPDTTEKPLIEQNSSILQQSSLLSHFTPRTPQQLIDYVESELKKLPVLIEYAILCYFRSVNVEKQIQYVIDNYLSINQCDEGASLAKVDAVVMKAIVLPHDQSLSVVQKTLQKFVKTLKNLDENQLNLNNTIIADERRRRLCGMAFNYHLVLSTFANRLALIINSGCRQIKFDTLEGVQTTFADAVQLAFDSSEVLRKKQFVLDQADEFCRKCSILVQNIECDFPDERFVAQQMTELTRTARAFTAEGLAVFDM